VVRVVDDPHEFLTQRPEAALAVLRMTAARLDGLTQYLVDVKQQFSGLTGHLGMVDQILDTLVHHQAPKARTGSVRDADGH
jgi:CRP/FNR family cyclic AMP-dependent transcriptional regulator